MIFKDVLGRRLRPGDVCIAARDDHGAAYLAIYIVVGHNEGASLHCRKYDIAAQRMADRLSALRSTESCLMRLPFLAIAAELGDVQAEKVAQVVRAVR